ncbi:hypothetical protein GCM10009552_22240 [Rothia nasimurium]|uniref:Uncharacterized protein n=1 Tax=Luteibacter anthropi TaxID=564369 RepID=A0A7X5UAK1_9GAMM|nr:hypothetical protein [Luteibacter anthropi]NII07001.1 hypothetical protein [Luteibacter anthropi]
MNAMNRPNYLALAASFVIATAALLVFSSTSTTAAPLSEINGTRVTNLAPIVVYASTADSVAAL